MTIGPIAALVTRAQSWIDREVGACDIALEIGKVHGLSVERRLEMLRSAAEVVGMDQCGIMYQPPQPGSWVWNLPCPEEPMSRRGGR